MKDSSIRSESSRLCLGRGKPTQSPNFSEKRFRDHGERPNGGLPSWAAALTVQMQASLAAQLTQMRTEQEVREATDRAALHGLIEVQDPFINFRKTKNHFLSFSSLSRFFSFFVSPSPDFAFFLSIFRSSFSAWVSGRGASCGGGCCVFCVSSSCFLPSMVVDGAEVSAADAADPSAAASEDDEDDARRDDSG